MRVAGVLFVVLSAGALAGCAAPPGDPGGEMPEAASPDPVVLAFYEALGAGLAVRFETDLGEVHMLLYEDLMPLTTARFAELVASGFYDGTLIHRVVDDFVVQGGDPSGTGALGSGETVPFEAHPDLHFGAGAVGLARDVDPDSGDSQWFITEKPQPHLHDASVSSTGAVFGTYAMYGQVFAGLDVVRRIAAVPTVPGLDRPVDDVRVVAAAIGERPALDLLGLPRHVVADAAAPVVADLERPLNLFAGHPARFVLYVEPEEGQGPPEAVQVALVDAAGAAAVNASLMALPDDPWVYAGPVLMPPQGAYSVVVDAGEPRAVGQVDVLPWHPAYVRFTAP